MVYPRGSRPTAAPRDVDMDAVRAACDADVPLDRRVGALWSLAGAPAFAPVDSRPLAQHLAALLNEPSYVVGSEAYEALLALSGADVALGAVDGRVVASPRPFAACEHDDRGGWCPDLDAAVVP